MQAYAYSAKRNDLATNQHSLWSRRCDYFDQVITEMMHTKLRSTFDSQVWANVIAGAEEDFETERRNLITQMQSVTQKMQSIVTNLSYVQVPSLFQALQQEYQNYELEQDRLQKKLVTLERRVQRQEALMQLAHQAENVLANWHQMSLNDQRTVAYAFIVRIVVTPTGKHRVADIEIQWRDESTDKFILPYRADKWILWTPAETESLSELLERQATQVEMAQAIPERKWRSIRIKIYEITGTRSFHIAPKVIRDEETYGEYLERLERKEDRQRHTGSARWQEDEMKRLEELLVSGATQLEIAAALPHRSWQAIRRRVILLRGPGFEIPEPGRLEDGETYEAYLSRDPSLAGTMAFQASGSLERQMLQNKKHHRSGLKRLNVVVLVPSSIFRASLRIVTLCP